MAITYAQAKKKALDVDPSYDVCYDYGDAWFFAPKVGGDGNSVVIMKSTGEEKPMFLYAIGGTGTAKPKKLNFATGRPSSAAKKPAKKK